MPQPFPSVLPQPQNPQPQNPAPPSTDIFKTASDWVDQTFKPVSEPLGSVLGGIGDRINPTWGKAFKQFGESVPRLAMDVALTGRSGMVPKVAGFGDVALQSLGQTADQGLTPVQRAVPAIAQTAAFGLAPKAAELGGAGMRALATPLASKMPTTAGALLQSAAEKGGNLVGMLGAFEAANKVSADVMNQPYDPLTPEHIAGTAANVLPFEALGLPATIQRFKDNRKTLWYDNLQKQVQAQEAAKAPILTQQRQDQDVNPSSPDAANPLAQETNPMPDWYAPTEAANRGPFQLDGPKRLLTDFPGKFKANDVYNRLRNTLHPDEFAWYDKAGLQDVLDKSKTSGDVAKWMQEVGPKAEVKVLRSGSNERTQAARSALTFQHELETRGLPIPTLEGNTWSISAERFRKGPVGPEDLEKVGYSPNEANLLREYINATSNVQSKDDGAFDPDVYRSIAPKDADQEVMMVRVPQDVKGQVDKLRKTPIGQATDEDIRRENALVGGTSQEGILHSGNHFGPEDRNVLGWARVQWENVGGKKVAHIIEVQSDWGQQQREQEKLDRQSNNGLGSDTKATAHPLLNDYSRLVLKSAIDHANKQGADAIVVSDAETAMMTEGHDLASRSWKVVDRDTGDVVAHARTQGEAESWVKFNEATRQRSYPNRPVLNTEIKEMVDIPQEPGMRLNYDRVLPTVASELTGEKGERVDIGEHQRAYVPGTNEDLSQDLQRLDGARQRGEITGTQYLEQRSALISSFEKGKYKSKARGDLIFRNPDGTPKTTASGQMFNLTKLKGVEEPFSLFGRDKLATRLARPRLMAQEIRELGRLEELGMDPQDLVSAAERMAAFDRKPGEGLVEYMMRRLNIDVNLNKPAKQDDLLRDAKQMVQEYTRDVLGMDQARADYWTEKFLKYVAMTGSTQRETRLLPALPYTRNGALRAASFYAPSRGDIPNAFIGVFQHTGYSPERSMFEFFHSTGHELFHGALLQAENKTFAGEMPEKMVEAAQNLLRAATEMNLSTAEMEQSIHGTLRMMAGTPYKSLLDYRAKHYTPDAEGRTEYLADMFGLVSMGAASPRKMGAYAHVNDLFKFANDDVRNFAQGVFRDIGTLWDFMKDFLSKVFGWKPSSIQTVADIVDNMKKLMTTNEQAEKAVEAFLRIQNTRDARPWAPISGLAYDRIEQLYNEIGAEGMDAEMKSLVKDVSPMVVPQADKPFPEDMGLGKRLKWIDYLNPQLWKSIPEWGDTVHLARNFGNLVRESAMKMFDNFKDPVTDKYDVDSMVRIARTGTPLNRAFNSVALRENSLTGDREGQRLTFNEISAVPEVKSLSPKDREYFNRFLDQKSAAMAQGAKQNVDSFKSEIAHRVGTVFMAEDRAMRWNDAAELGKALTNTFVDVDRLNGGQMSDPELHRQYAEAQKTLQDWVAKDPENAARLQRISEIFTLDQRGRPLEPGAIPDIAQKFMEYRGKLLGGWVAPDAKNAVWHFEGKPGYTPEVRLGRWSLYHNSKDGKDEKYVSFDKKADYDKAYIAAHARLQKGELAYVKGFDREDQRDAFRGLRPDTMSAYMDATTAVVNRVAEKLAKLNPGDTELINQMRDEIRPGKEIAALLESPYMKERRLIGGREELNMAQGVIHYINAVSHTTGKRYARGQQRLFLNDPQMKASPNLKMNAQKYFNEIVDPTERGFGFFKSLMSLNYIFFSPSLAMVELTQQGTNHLPAMAAAGVPLGKAANMIKQAGVDMMRATVKGKFKDHVYDSDLDTNAIKKATQTGIIDQGWLRELFHLEDDLPFINSRNHLVGNGEILDRTGLIGKPLYHLYKLGRDAHSLAIRVNTEVAFLSSIRHFRSLGESEDVAFQHAADMTQESMHGGGRATRPLWYLGVGKPNLGSTVGGMMYFLQTYVYNTVAQQARYLKNAIGGSNLSTAERVGAAKAAATMIGAQLTLAGVMGLPVTAQMFALVEQAFPNTEPKRRAREMFFGLGKWLNSKTHLAGQDEDMGHFVADTAMDGLTGTLSPWNMSNRFELGVLMGVDPYNGFNWKNVVGPGGPLLEQMLLKPAQELSEGHPLDAAIAALPNSNARRLATLASNGWNLRNKDNRLNLELTNGEAVGSALGFTPKRVADFQNLDSMKRRAEKVSAAEQKQFHEELAGMLEEGRTGEVQSRLLQRAATTENYDPRQGAQQVAELYQQRTQPFDPVREGSRVGQTYNVSQLFPSTRSPMSEVQRLLQKQQLTSAVGFPQTLGRTSVREAQLVDQLLALHPQMSRAEALAMLEHTLHPRSGMYSNQVGASY